MADARIEDYPAEVRAVLKNHVHDPAELHGHVINGRNYWHVHPALPEDHTHG